MQQAVVIPRTNDVCLRRRGHLGGVAAGAARMRMEKVWSPGLWTERRTRIHGVWPYTCENPYEIMWTIVKVWEVVKSLSPKSKLKRQKFAVPGNRSKC